ncbi:MAG: hypothetical protein PHN49_09615 [Candidatus Omnitrophica bacterium]|nr:hypothetical protein [Candidatus Omnitrophota bacterium]
MIPSEALRLILEKAILAPSADNLQPWKFCFEQDFVDVFLDRQRLANFCDEALLMPYLSAGAVIENMRVAATRVGYRTIPTYLPEPENAYWVARLEFEAGVKKCDERFRALGERVTNRKFFSRKKELSGSLYGRLGNIAKMESGFKLLFIKGNETGYRELVALIGKADELRFESKRLHEELMGLMRFNAKDAERTRDGLDARTLEAGPAGTMMFRSIRSWKMLSCLNALGMSKLFNRYARMQMDSSQAAGLLVAPSQKPQDYIRGGELVQRIWHQLTMEGVALQPMDALPIFILNLQQNGGKDFTEAQKKVLFDLKARFFSLFHITDQNGLLFLFRLGYAEPPRYRSFRRRLDSFIMAT